MATTAEPGVTRRGATEVDPLYPSAPSHLGSNPGVVEISLLDVLLVLAKRRRFILLFTFVCTALGLGIACLQTPVFTARTVILPPQQGGSGSGLMSELSSLGALGGLAGGSLGLKNAGDMYVALFRSATVEDAVIQQFHLMQVYHQKYLSHARAALEGNVAIGADNKTSLITLSVKDPDPKRAAAIANGYVDQYRHLSEHLAISEAAQRRVFFQQQLLDAKNNLANAEEALVKTQKTTGLLELNSQARALIEAAASLRAQIAAKQVQIQGMETYAATDNAALIQAQQELAGLRAQLVKLGGNGDINGGDLIVPGGKVPTASLEYARRLRDVKYNETIFNILARQFEVAKLDEAREGALVQVVDPATPPDWKSGPKRSRWTIVAFAAGFLLSCIIVLAQAAMRVLHRDPETDTKLHALRRMLVPWGKERRA